MASRAGPVRAFPMQQGGSSASQRMDADDPFRAHQSNRSGRTPVPPIRSQGIPVGPTLKPDLSYRAPGGTVLNRVPHSARAAQELELNRRETVERLREKAMDRRIAQAMAVVQRSRPASAGASGSRHSASAKKASGGKLSAAQRHAQQQFRAENSFVSQDELQHITQPLQLSSRPQSAQQRPSSAGGKHTANGRPGSARPSEPLNPLLSHSTQSRLTASQIAEQPVAGIPSNQGAGNDLASILGGGHEYVVFGNKNAPTAQTRRRVPEQAPLPPPLVSPEVAAAYAPFATHDLRADVAGSPLRYNDPQSGAVVVRDELSREAHHAPAAIGFGKRHAGYKEYVARPAAASAAARHAQAAGEVTMTADPFGVSKGNSILSWESAEGRSRKEELRAQQEALWSRTSADYGVARDDPNLSRPVAGLVIGNQEPLMLTHGEASVRANNGSGSVRPASASTSSRTHRHGPSCGASCRRRSLGAPALTSSNPFASSANNPLNPYTPAELAQMSQRPTNLRASALGFGKSHPAYKTHVLANMAPQTVQQQP